MLELYHYPMSTCSQKVRLCLAEKSLQWIDRTVDLARREQASPEYLAINPNGVVPTLVHDNEVITDSSAICEYLEETHTGQGTSLSPGDPLGRARMRAWMRYIEEVPTAAIRYPSFNHLFLPAYAALDAEDFESFTDQLPLRQHFMKKMGQDGFDQDEMDASMARLRQTLERVNDATTVSPWVLGTTFSLVEIGLTPTLVRLEDLQLTHLWKDLPHVQPWFDRIQARPSFPAAYIEGSRVPIDRNPFAP